jgi:hypothetical protein
MINIYGMHLPCTFPRVKNLRIISTFHSGPELEMLDEEFPGVESYDCEFSDMYWHFKATQPDLAILNTTYPFVDDDSGSMQICAGTNNDYILDIIEQIKDLPVFGVWNTKMPRPFGNWFPAKRIVGHMESTRPLYIHHDPAPTAKGKAMAKHVASKIDKHRLTVQCGVGPAAVALMDEIGEDVTAGWGELASNWVKKVNPGAPIVSTIGFGDEEFYKLVDRNPCFWFLPARVTNSRENLQSHNVTSVNQVQQLNLLGGTAVGVSRTSKMQRRSGKGGGVETTYGAKTSFLLAPDTFRVDGQEVCAVTALLPEFSLGMYSPTKTARYLVTPTGIFETWPHWEGDTFFDGTARSIAEGIIQNLVPEKFRTRLTAEALRKGVLTSLLEV